MTGPVTNRWIDFNLEDAVSDDAVIVLADDDIEVAELVVAALSIHGFVVHHVARGDLVEAAVERYAPDVVILDVMMPGATGIEVCRTLRAQRPSLPIVLLTGLDAEVDEVVGLEVGADDYLTKPVHPRVLLARLRSLLRRSRRPEPDLLRVGPLEVAPGARVARIDGEPIELTDAEFALLLLFVRHAGTVLSRDRLYKELRGIRWDGVDRSMDQRVSRLRARLGDRRKLIRAVRGEGYQLLRE